MFNSKVKKIFKLSALIGVFLIGQQAMAKDLMTKKEVFKLDTYTTVGGKTIKNVQVGWESYGKLNARKDNAILVCHPFTANSHAAGKYAKDDVAPGYWDKIIGPGKAIDTNKYFVLSVDSLVNLNIHAPNVITTGPASINPDTGKPYGMSFPIVTMKDFVNVQRELVKTLGIKKLHAVVGASMGSMQTYEWAASYPKMVGRIMPVIGAAFASDYLIASTDMWATPIMLDKNWNNGDYYGKDLPLDGLAMSLKLLTLNSMSYKGLNEKYQQKWAKDDKNPLDSFENTYAVQNYYEDTGKARAKLADANSMLYLIKANQLFYSGKGDKNYKKGLKNIKMPVLFFYSELDRVFNPEEVEQTIKLFKANGAKVKAYKLPGKDGHYDGILQIHKYSKQIKKFIEAK